MPGPNQITSANLMRLLGTPDAPQIIDLRTPDDANADPRTIPTARRLPYQNIADHVETLRGHHIILSCQRGAKLSEGAAALLRCHGLRAETLAGGHLAWAAAALPLTPAAALPASDLWVTRHRPKIDRIACPWLLRRFVNPAARILYVAPSDVLAVAERFNATPFDIEGTFWSHRGDTCTFDTMLTEFGLQTEALARLALVVRAADTDRHDLSPQAAGLLALSVGLSRMFRDDLAQLAAGLNLYDALYRWARDGHEESHDWPAGRAE